MKKGFRHIIVLLIIAIVAVLLLTVLYQDVKRRNILLTEKKNLEQRLAAFIAEKENLTNQLKNINQSTVLEDEARTMLGMKKPGEKVVILVPPKTSQIDTNIEKKGVFNQILTWFRNIWQNLADKK